MHLIQSVVNQNRSISFRPPSAWPAVVTGMTMNADWPNRITWPHSSLLRRKMIRVKTIVFSCLRFKKLIMLHSLNINVFFQIESNLILDLTSNGTTRRMLICWFRKCINNIFKYWFNGPTSHFCLLTAKDNEQRHWNAADFVFGLNRSRFRQFFNFLKAEIERNRMTFISK